MTLTDEQRSKLDKAQDILQYRFANEHFLLAAVTHPSAVEGRAIKYSYERLEFLGDSILGAIVATEAFERFHDLDEGGLTRIKVALVAGSTLADVAGRVWDSPTSSCSAPPRRARASAACTPRSRTSTRPSWGRCTWTAASRPPARSSRARCSPSMSAELALEPENPKSALQEKLQEDGITPTYKLVETQGPPHDRTFVAQVFAGSQGLALGTGRTKKEAESQAAKSTLARLGEFFGLGMDDKARAVKAEAQAKAKAEKAEAAAKARAAKAEEKARRKTERELAKQQRKAGQ